MVWVAIAPDGSKSTLVFNGEGVKINRVYQQIMQRHGLPWLSFGRRYVFTYIAPAQTAILNHITGARDISMAILKSQFVFHQALTLTL